MTPLTPPSHATVRQEDVGRLDLVDSPPSQATARQPSLGRRLKILFRLLPGRHEIRTGFRLPGRRVRWRKKRRFDHASSPLKTTSYWRTTSLTTLMVSPIRAWFLEFRVPHSAFGTFRIRKTPLRAHLLLVYNLALRVFSIETCPGALGGFRGNLGRPTL